MDKMRSLACHRLTLGSCKQAKGHALLGTDVCDCNASEKWAFEGADWFASST